MKGQEIISQKELLKELDLLWFKKEEERKKKNKERYVLKYLKNYYLGAEVHLLLFLLKAQWEPIVKIIWGQFSLPH